MRNLALLLIAIFVLAGCSSRYALSPTIKAAMVDTAAVVENASTSGPPVVEMVIYEGALLDGGYSSYLDTEVRVFGSQIRVMPRVRHTEAGALPLEVRKRRIYCPLNGLAPGQYWVEVIDCNRTIVIPTHVGRG